MTMTLELRVTATETIARDVRTITLSQGDGASLPAWQPGAHLEVQLPGELVRHYSLCSDPADADQWRIAVLHEPEGRGGSAFLHTSLRVGDRLAASVPRDNFGYTPGAHPQLFVAGGIGITPLLPMLRAAERAGADWRLLYLGRSLASMGFTDELAGYGDRVIVHPRDTAGAFDLAAGLDELDGALQGPQVYVCGPNRMIDAALEWSENDPARSERLHLERFTGDGAGVREGDEAFVVEIADGTEVEVAADESILAALTRCGVPALNSCQEGICGTCETTVIEGVPDHRDSLLSEDERAANETMMICVSRCLGKRLVLDL